MKKLALLPVLLLLIIFVTICSCNSADTLQGGSCNYKVHYNLLNTHRQEGEPEYWAAGVEFTDSLGNHFWPLTSAEIDMLNTRGANNASDRPQ